ncbi:MAG: hypothetical protein QNJ45_21115 [Ardenticatenaceae bacterium]|nr:hypothetical protein [Ardenticatenaceae bacterium]
MEYSFETADLKGLFVADSEAYSPNHRHHIRNLLHKPTGFYVTPTEDAQKHHSGLCNFFRAYARNSWLTEPRAMPSAVTLLKSGVQLKWNPILQHQAKVEATYTIQEPNIIDIEVTVEGYNHYPDYELVFSNYHAPALKGGAYVKTESVSDNEIIEEIMITDNDLFHGMYPFFPRDLSAAQMLNDGRSRKGRWYYRPVCGRLYGYPMGFATNETTEILVMGKTEDVAAVGVTYAAEGARYDDVAQHHAIYLSLFGRDLNPGDGWRTNIRVIVMKAGNSEKRIQRYREFLAAVEGIDRRFEVDPTTFG